VRFIAFTRRGPSTGSDHCSEDIRKLAAVLDLHTPDEVFASVREIFPDEAPPERLRLLLEDIFSDEDDRNP
jgi:hypothetical protein